MACACCHSPGPLQGARAGALCRPCTYEGCAECTDLDHHTNPSSPAAIACRRFFCAYYAGAGRR